MPGGVRVRVVDGIRVADDRGTVHGPGEDFTVPAALAESLLVEGLVTKVRAVRDKRTRKPTGNR